MTLPTDENDKYIYSEGEESDVEEVIDEEVSGRGDAEYELNKPEGTVVTAAEWQKCFETTPHFMALEQQLLEIKPFRRCDTTGRIQPTVSLNNVFEGICLYLDSGNAIDPKILVGQVESLFSKCDILYGVLKQLSRAVKNFSSENTWMNIFHFLKNVSHPSTKIVPRLFKLKYHYLRSQSKSKMIGAYESVWLAVMNCKIPKKVLAKIIPYISSNVLGNLRQPHITADFFFRTFDLGSIFSVLSLEALFRLMVEHNFEYPNFYDKVYQMCSSSLLYTEQKQKFLELLDKFLSSSHVPLYIIAGFAKRLARMLLVAPLDAEEPVLGLVRNLITRHPGLSHLLHREIPDSCQGDPYDENEALSRCNAMQSALWELKTLKRHWHSNVQKRAAFVDKPFQKTESFVRFRCQDEYFSVMMNKRFGSEIDNIQEGYAKAQDGSDDDEPVAKKTKLINKGKFARKHEVEKEHLIPINFVAPTGKFLPENAFNYVYSDFWTV